MNQLQVSASAVAAKQETNTSLGAVHIDFTLIRVQPPAEYQGLGGSLSKARKTEAEDLGTHETASKLGVLFDGVVPSVPNLISAYGTRCSDIAKSPVLNPQGNHKHGLFRDQVGADGTSIWAAATSGTPSIAVHLLACMLARIWDGPKAVSIWMELITIRKEALAKSGKPLDYHASKIVLSREEISSWDASARAWKLTADSANERWQKQLLLIIDHLGLPVNAKLDLGESVIDAWKTAMIAVDKLVAGEGQVVHVAAPLLGLAAWHLYPDMLILGRDKGGQKLVKQKDPLIRRGGLLTLGLEDTRRHGEGIYWSLPLAHLRYYGDPVQTEARLSTQTSRVTIRQLLYIALGSLMRRWCTKSDDIDLAVQLIDKLETFTGASQSSWMRFLADTARSYLRADAEKKSQILQLIKCGRRRYPAFIDDLSAKPIFGLSNCSTLLRLMPTNDARIRMLRQVSKDFGDHRELMLIQCRPELPMLGWELATAQPLDLFSGEQKHIRWLHQDQVDYELEDSRLSRLRASSLVIRLGRGDHVPQFRTDYDYSWLNVPREVYQPICYSHEGGGPWLQAQSATITPRVVFGDPNIAALYTISITYWSRGANFDARVMQQKEIRELPNILVLRHVFNSINDKLLSRSLVAQYFQQQDEWRSDAPVIEVISSNHIRPLRALMTVCHLYSRLSNASLEIRTASKPLGSHAWIPDFQHRDHQGPFHLSLEQTLACIARFESGNFNVSPSTLRGVFAFAYGNSLFVAKCLLQDPNTPPTYPFVERLAGNIGQSGMALLVAPQTLKVRKLSDDFRLVNHNKFDGRESDSFEPTSLHMSFTEWRMPLDVGSRGIRDVEAYYIEAPIKVHDHGDFVADVNILDIFKHLKSRIIPPCRERHAKVHASEIVEKLSGAVAIDSWEELLDSPPEIGVVRAYNNWQARLATAALALRQGHEVRILNPEACWTCATRLPAIKTSEEEEELNDDDDDDMITAPESLCCESDSDSEIDDELERHRRHPNKRIKLDVGSPMDTTPLAQPQQTHRNTVYIF